MKDVYFVCWDYKEQPSFDKVNAALAKIDGPAHITEVDTNSDMCGIAIHARGRTFSKKELHDAFWDDEDKLT